MSRRNLLRGKLLSRCSSRQPRQGSADRMELSLTKLRIPAIVVLAYALWLMPASAVAWGVTPASLVAQTESHPAAPESAKGHKGSKEAEAGSGHEAGEKSEKK